jgi:hypothetical protein
MSSAFLVGFLTVGAGAVGIGLAGNGAPVWSVLVGSIGAVTALQVAYLAGCLVRAVSH